MANIPADAYDSVREPVSDELKRYILQKCWGKTWADHMAFAQASAIYQPYFDHYQKVCQNGSTDDVGQLQHIDLLDAFEQITTETFDFCKAELTKRLNVPHLFPSGPFVHSWIVQTGRALLLLDLCEWEGTKTLKAYLTDVHFAASQQDDSFRIPVSLNVNNLRRIGGLTIRWTDLLSEHLSLEEETRLAIFHHMSFLDILQDSGHYPDNMANEVRRTLGMLIPREHPKSREWCQKQVIHYNRRAPGSSRTLDPTVTRAGPLKPGERNIQRLTYFRDRMISIKDVYDSHEPQSFMQHIWDGRRPARRWGFIIAAMIFLFGVGQLIEGAIQCYKSYVPTNS